MSDVVLAQASCTRAHSVAELADPTPIILAHVEVIFIEAHEARVAELPIAAIVWHFRELKMSLKVDIRIPFSVYLQQLGDENLH